MKKAFITGITGQDGSYLAELLLEKGYEVHGMIRRSSTFNTSRLNDSRLFLHYGDLSDSSSINHIIEKVRPDEVYHLGAQSHVKVSFEMPEYTADITGLGTLRILNAIRTSGLKTKFYQASSSEMFGKVKPEYLPLTEDAPFHPRSPYGCAKLYAYWLTRNYRESYGMFTVNGILFNHESPRRGETFVTRKITQGLARIKLGKQEKLFLGNLDAKRDWGHAKDFVRGMWLMLQHDTPDDYILSTNESHSVREFAEVAAKHIGIDLQWEGSGMAEKGIDKKTGKTIIEIDPEFFRPAEVDVLLGDYSKAKKILGWEPETTFTKLAEQMAQADYENESKVYKVESL